MIREYAVPARWLYWDRKTDLPFWSVWCWECLRILLTVERDRLLRWSLFTNESYSGFRKVYSMNVNRVFRYILNLHLFLRLLQSVYIATLFYFLCSVNTYVLRVSRNRKMDDVEVKYMADLLCSCWLMYLIDRQIDR